MSGLFERVASDVECGSSQVAMQADNIFILRQMPDNKLEVSGVKLRYTAEAKPVLMKIIPEQHKLVTITPDFEFAPVGK